jgi:hypothetical protein
MRPSDMRAVAFIMKALHSNCAFWVRANLAGRHVADRIEEDDRVM